MRLDEQTCYNPTGMARDGSQEFINGNIGCVGPVGTWLAPTYKTITDFKWDVVPAPYASGAGVDHFPDRLDDEQHLPRAGGGLRTDPFPLRQGRPIACGEIGIGDAVSPQRDGDVPEPPAAG